jgi:ABC-type glutathione transport system ATPase component
MVLLEARNICKTFPIEGGIFRRRIGTVQALKDVSISIQKGETLALVGGSGCGKSTFARILAGLITADSGDLIWEGMSLERYSRRERAKRVQMIFQDPFASLNPKLSVGTQLGEVLHSSSSAAALLQTVGLEAEAAGHYPFQFSGGQRQRIAIARALAPQPELLIADEPLSALDVTIQSHILRLFKKLKSDYNLTILFITHDLAVAEEFADRVAVIENGCLVEEGSAREILSEPKHTYTQALLRAVPKLP